jgi:chaperonin GroES
VVEKIKIEEFVPIDDRILVKPHEEDDQTEGGVYLPATAVAQKKEIIQSGEVVAVGPGRLTPDGKHEEMLPGLKVGTTVFFARFQGWLFEVDGVEYRVFGQHDLFGYKEER